MKKRIFALCIAVMLIALSFNVLAQSEYLRIQDFAGLLDESEYEQVLSLLDEVSERQNMDIVIITVDTPDEGLTVEEDATEWYEALEFNSDGVLLYMSMEERDWYMLTSGFGITAITDAGIDYISEKFLSPMSEGDYVTAFSTYIQYTDEFITQAKTGKPYDVGNMPKAPYDFTMSLVISVVIGFVVSGIITGMWKNQLKSVEMQRAASSYLKPGSLNISYTRDLFLYKTVNRTEKQKDSDGGSSTHKSSSGKTYGGKGGKF